MSEVIRILQLGSEDWNECYRIPNNVRVTFAEVFENVPKTPYDLVFVDRELSNVEIQPIHKAAKAYTLFVTDRAVMTEGLEYLYACKKGKTIKREEVQAFLDTEARNYFSKPYGEKFQMQGLSIAQGFDGSVLWDGNYSVTVEGDYGKDMNQIAYWRYNIPVEQGEAIEMWLEYEKSDDVEIALSITQFVRGSISDVQQKWYFTEKDLQEPVLIDNQKPTGVIYVSLLAKGSGMLKIIALHDRHSRRGHGLFLPGGERFVTRKREEIFYYFDPGDLRPPLNVYFSGYKTLQGFEGYYMMRGMGCPFLLIGEPRMEGGCFYMGDEEYERGFAEIIRKCMDDLGFSREQVILSGLSMGSFGALYYGCDILPHAMIVGKPLVSIGDVALNERVHRPGGFPTSLDVLNYIGEGTDENAIRNLNQRFWDKFDKTDWGKSKFIMSYMIEDDYDSTAYNTLIAHLKDDGVQLYGKGIHGRHNDATSDIVSWFKSQYDKILYEDFGRG